MSTTRRTFVRSIAYAGAAWTAWAPLVRAAPASSKVRHVCIGGEGMGAADMQALARHRAFSLHAVCDVDERHFATAKTKVNAEARTYTDWRRLLDAEEKNFDAANVSVPDHMHAPIAMSLIHRGKHVYCQKPLTHDIYEARKVREAAETSGLVTQMGIQVHSMLVYRLPRELIRAGHIGKVREVHAWSGKSWGGKDRPAGSDAIPASLKWDLWLGTAPSRPYVEKAYHPQQWRCHLDFGTGTFGDMGCHILDPIYESLELSAPTELISTGGAATTESWPVGAVVRYRFPRTPHTAGPLTLTWYDGGAQPPKEVLGLLGDVRPPGEGSIFVGESGTMLLPHVATPRLFPAEKFRDVKYPQIATTDHWLQFIDAVRGEGKTMAPFSYSGPLTETVLLGGVAVRLPNESLKWDSQKLSFGRSDADGCLRREYRAGWEVAGL